MAQLVNKETLIKRYLRKINRVGLETFVAEDFAALEAAEADGEVTSTGTLDENTTIRRSALPIEFRVACAEAAIEHFENETEPGGRTVLINRGTSTVGS